MSVSAEVARDAVTAAMDAVGLSSAAPGPDHGADLDIDVNGVRLAIQLKAASTVTPDSLRRWAGQRHADDAVVTVLVADRVLPSARPALDDLGLGWLDLRGHLRLSAPGVLIDADVPATRRLGGPADPFSGDVGLGVACALLLKPHEPVRVRAIARALGRSPSSVSSVVDRLRNEALITGQDQPAVPDLFWALAAIWRPAQVQLATVPDLADPVVAAALRIGWGDSSAESGWVLTGELAASVYGAPIGVSSDYPPSFYVPDEATARRAETLLGVPQRNATPSATLRVAPAPQVCEFSFTSTAFPGKPWPLAHPLFVALDLACDPGRGSEVLAGWRPQEETVRVW
jgi:hypothetical protein